MRLSTIFLLVASTSARQCNTTKCTSLIGNDCIAEAGEQCSCQPGYEAVIEREDPSGFPYYSTIVHYTCCENDNDIMNEESYHCASSLIPMTDVVPEGFEECTWDKCNRNYPENVFDGDPSHCFALPGESCQCDDGYVAKRTGKILPIHDFHEQGEIMYAYQFICCKVPVTSITTTSTTERKYEGRMCAVPDCNEQCQSSDVCFAELGCFSPENLEEYSGCVANKCNSDYGIDCWVRRGQGCSCDDGLVAKRTGRSSKFDGTAEYVCCPPTTPGVEGEQCNPSSATLGLSWFVFFSFLFPLSFAICRKVLSVKGKSNGVTNAGTAGTDADDNDSGENRVDSLALIRQDLCRLQEDTADKVKEQTELMERLLQLEKQHGEDRGGGFNKVYVNQNMDLPAATAIFNVNRSYTSLVSHESGSSHCSGKGRSNHTRRRTKRHRGVAAGGIQDKNGNDDDEHDVRSVASYDSGASSCGSDTRSTNTRRRRRRRRRKRQEKNNNHSVVPHGGIIVQGIPDNDAENISEMLFDEQGHSEEYLKKMLGTETCTVEPPDKDNLKVLAETVGGAFDSGMFDGTSRDFSDCLDGIAEQYGTIDPDRIAEENRARRTGQAGARGLLTGGVAMRRHKNVGDDSNSRNFYEGEFEGIHQYVLHHITSFNWEKKKTFRKTVKAYCNAFVAPLLSWFFLLLPLYILFMIGHESQNPKCMFGCEREGEVCLGDLDDGREPMCAGTGEVCSFLKHTTNPTPSSTIIACMFAFAYVLCGSIADMEQNHRAIRAATYRFKVRKGKNNIINTWIRFNLWSINLVRAYLIPGATFMGSIAMVHYAEDSLKISSILLNGVAIIIIGEIDDFIGVYFVSSDTQEKVSEDMEAALAASYDAMGNERQAKNCRKTSWLMDRVMNTIMYIITVIIAMRPLDVMFLIMGGTGCEFFITVQILPIYIGAGFAAVDKSLHGQPPSWVILFGEFLLNTIFLGLLTFFTSALAALRNASFEDVYNGNLENAELL